MRPTLLRSLLALGALCGALSAPEGHAQQVPAGWTRDRDPAPGFARFVPERLAAGERTEVLLYPRSPLNGLLLEAWLSDLAAKDAPPTGGAWLSNVNTERKAQGLAIGTRAYRDASGSTGVAIYAAASSDGLHARVMRWISSTADTAQRHQGPAGQLMAQLAALEELAPEQVTSAPEPSKQETQRYRFVTTPGQGVKPQDIQAVVYAWQQMYTIGGLQMVDHVYLLLKDGTAHEDLPVPPQDMDVSLSRRMEPKTWGRWRKNGDTYSFTWPDAPNEWRSVNGWAVEPGRRGQLLQGQWMKGASYSMPGASSWATWGVQLKPDGRFEKFHSGGAAAGGGAGGTFTASRYGDDGAVTSTTGPNVAIGSGTPRRNGGDRTGRYEIEPYAITLRFDNGTVERQAFFISDGTQKMIWFGGTLLTGH